MTTYYKRGKVYYVGLPVHPTGMIKKATGTHLEGIAASMSKMMDDLGPRGRREWKLLDAVRDNRLSVGLLHDAWLAGKPALDALLADLADTDAQPLIPGWLKFLDDHVALDTIQHYSAHVRTFIPKGERFPVSRISRAGLTKWLTALECGASTKRKYRAAMSSFCTYLVDMDVIPFNPMLQVKAPKANAPRMSYIEPEQVLKLVELQAEPYRTISALMHATGTEISAVLRLKKSDLDSEHWTVRAFGTKNKYRDRDAYLLPWVRPFIIERVRTLLPNAPLFPGTDRWRARDSHVEACDKLGLKNYTLRDSRHSFCVTAMKSGILPEEISKQLGHSSTQMVINTYGRYMPAHHERTKMFDVMDYRFRKAEGA